MPYCLLDVVINSLLEGLLEGYDCVRVLAAYVCSDVGCLCALQITVRAFVRPLPRVCSHVEGHITLSCGCVEAHLALYQDQHSIEGLFQQIYPRRLP